MSQRGFRSGKKPMSAVSSTSYKPINDGSNSVEQQLPTIQAGKSISWLEVLLTVAIVPGCTVAILLVVAYLTFIWFQDSSNETWHRIVLSNWITTSVAICGIVLRWATSFQLGLCTSILALNVLKTGSSLAIIPQISSLRFKNSGPLDFVLLQSWPRFKPREVYLFILINFSILTTILLQLSSTLLLSDLSTTPIPTFANYTTNALLVGEDLRHEIERNYFSDAMRTTSPSFPLFAELSSQSPFSGDDAVDDTGPTIRALLPVTADNGRSHLLEFAGNATLYDARWICTRPSLTNLNLVGDNLEFYLSGNVNHSVYHPPLVPASPDPPPKFNCTLESTLPEVWTVFSCNVNFDFNAVLQGVTNSVGNPVVYLTDNHRDVGFSWLVINVTALDVPPKPNNSYLNGALAFKDSNEFVAKPNGHWASITSTQQDGIVYKAQNNGTRDIITSGGNWTFTIDASICSSAFSFTRNMHILARRDHIDDEPVTVSAGKKQIGATQAHYSIQDRGILEMNETEFQRQQTLPQNLLSIDEVSTTPTITSRLFIPRQASTTITMDDRVWINRDDNLKCDTAASSYTQCPRLVHEDRVALFQSIITETNSPALAMQAMQHTLITDRFYRYMPNFKIASTQQLIYSENAIQPVRIRGYITVMCAIGAHFILVSNILIVLGVLRGTKQTLSSVNQAWQTIGQVALLQQEISVAYPGEDGLCSTTATDHQAKNHIINRHLQDKIYVLQERSGEGVVRFRPTDEREDVGFESMRHSTFMPKAATNDDKASKPAREQDVQMAVLTRERQSSVHSVTMSQSDEHSTVDVLTARANNL